MKHDGWAPLDGQKKGWDAHHFHGWYAVVPSGDLEEHWTDNLACPCRPKWDAASRSLLHFAFDGRDLVERLERGQEIL